MTTLLREHGARRRLVALLSAFALVVGTSVASILVNPPPAQAADPVNCTTLYAIQQSGTHNLYTIDRTTGQRTPLFSLTGQAGLGTNNLINGLAVDPRNGMLYAVSQAGSPTGSASQTSATIYRIDPVTETMTAVGTMNFPAPVPTNTGVVMGGMATGGILYFAYIDTQGRAHILGYNVDTATPVPGEIGWVQLDVNGNGDLVVDATNNVWIVTGQKVYRTLEPLSSTGGTGGQLAVTTWASMTSTYSFNSVAVGPDGYIYVGSGATSPGGSLTVYRVDPSAPNSVVALPSTAGGEFSDMASCSAMNVLRVEKDLPDGRVVAADQFQVTISYKGTIEASATTQGTNSGVQSDAAEIAVLGALPNGSYTISETPVSGALQTNYVSSWACTAYGATPAGPMGTLQPIEGWEAHGNGTTGDVQFPSYPVGSGDIQYATGIQVMCKFTNVFAAPAIQIVKSSSGPAEVDGTITYTFDVTNTGNVPLTGVTVTDPMTANGLTLTGCDLGTMQPLDVQQCTGELVVTQAMFDAGTLTNTATATGTPPSGTPVTDDDSTTVDFTTLFAPEISLVKSADATQVGSVGDPVNYTFTVTNTGNVTLHNVNVTDPMTADGLVLTGCDDLGTLEPTQSAECNGTYAVTQPDVDSGHVINTATAEGTPPVGEPVTDDDTAIIPAPSGPDIDITKTAQPNTVTHAGQTVTYTFHVTNTGNVSLDNVHVTDPMTANGLVLTGCDDLGTLASGAEAECTGTYNVTVADMNAGKIDNTATATGTSPADGDVTANDSATVTATQSPAITLEKSAAPTTVSTEGATITYTYKVTNSGNVTLNNVNVTDPKTGVTLASSCSALGTLIPQASVTCTGTYTVTKTDLLATSISNTATAKGTPPTGAQVSDDDTAVVTVPDRSTISITKTANPTAVAAVGDTVYYTFDVTNTGNQPLTDVTVTDPLPNIHLVSCALGTLIPGQTASCMGTYTVVQGDLDAGKIDNTATVTGKDPSGANVTDTDSATVLTTLTPAIKLTKTADKTSVSAVDEVITYTFTVENTGNVTIPQVTVTDQLAGVTLAASCATLGPIAPTKTASCTGTYKVTQADLDAEKIHNVAVATGTAPDGGGDPPPPATDDEDTPTTDNPAIQLAKSASPTSVTGAGQTVTYTLKVTNTGNVTLTDVHVTDTTLPGLTLSPACATLGTLAPGRSAQCTGTYVSTLADMNAGHFSNTATATGTPPLNGTPVTDTDTANVLTTSGPSIGLDKTPSVTTVTAAGTVITYTFTVTNTGNVTLNNVAVTDPLPGMTLSPTCSNLGTVEPTKTASCTGTYTVKLSDMNAGQIDNTATATGNPPTGSPVTGHDSATVTATQTPALKLTKTADKASVSAVDEVITYTFTVTNTGNVTIPRATVTDRMAGVQLAAACATLGPIEPTKTASCTGTYKVTQADLDAPTVHNVAVVTGTPPEDGGDPPPPDETDNDVPTTDHPSIQVTKTADRPSVTAANQVVTYTFVVKNTGNVTLTNITLADPLPGIILTGCDALPDLAPTKTAQCSGTYTVKQSDINAGTVANTATATGTPPGGADPVTDDDTATVAVIQGPAIQLVKTATEPTVSATTDTVHYTFTVTNIGNVQLSNIVVTDVSLPGLTLEAKCGALGTLAPNQSTSCTGTYPVKQADLDKGKIDNTATVTGTPPGGATPVTDTDSKTVTATQTPALKLTKTADKTSVSAVGQVITYTFTVTNTGNVTIPKATVTDQLAGVTLDASCAALGPIAPTKTASCTGTYTVKQTDLDAPSVHNTAVVTGTPPEDGGDPPPPDEDENDVPTIDNPGIQVVKSANPASVATVGQVVTYTFTVTNTGNVTLTNIRVTDVSLPGLTVNPSCATLGSLAPTRSAQCTATYTITQPDMNRGQVANTATVTGTPPGGANPVTDTDTATVLTTAGPQIGLDKTPNVTTVSREGDTVVYTFTVTNIGNVTLHNVSVTDNLPGVTLDTNCAALGTIDPTKTAQCTGTYKVKQSDMDAGKIINVGTATGTPPTGPAVTGHDTATVTGAQSATLKLTKTADKTSVSAVGQVITYTFTVTNTGNVTVPRATVTDQMDGVVLSAACAALGPIAPTKSASCTGTYTVKQTDLDKTSINNTAVVTGTPPNDDTEPPPPDEDEVDVPTTHNPGIQVTKTSSPTTVTNANTVVTYTFTVKNTGNVTLTGITLADPLPGLTLTGCDTLPDLAPMRSAQCTGTYTVTQADINAGGVTNTAVATGTPPGDDAQPVTDDDTATVVSPDHSGITVDKATTVTSVTAAGQTIPYTFTVTNTGNTTLTNVAVTDSLPGVHLDATCANLGTLKPTETAQCTGSYVVTQPDMNAGQIRNVATVTAKSPSNSDVTGTDTVITTATQRGAVTVDKSTTVTRLPAVDTLLPYTFTVKNTGTVTLTNVVVTDPLPGLTLTGCSIGTLQPGEERICTALYTVKQSDVDAGRVVNTATVTGNPPTGAAVTDTSTLTVTGAGVPGIHLTKESSSPTIVHAGDRITYTFTAKNTGTLTLTNVVVTDPLPGLTQHTCALGTLAPGQSRMCQIDYVVTQTDVDKGGIVNHATVSGKTPNQEDTTDDTTTTVPSVATPGLSVHKSADKTGVTKAGDQITYTFLVTNTGNVTLNHVKVTDSLPGIHLDSRCADLGTVAPGRTASCVGVYIVTPADLDAGHIINVAGGTGTPPATEEEPNPQPIPVTPSNQVDVAVQKAVVGDFVWNDLNGNGLQDPGEPGVAGVTVKLARINDNGTTTTYETVTNANGAYSFTVPPSGVTGYTLTFVPPAGMVFTEQHAGDPARDSDPDATGTVSGVVGIGGQTNNTIDAGLFTPALVRQLVWNDVNRDGIHQADEPLGVRVSVQLTGADGMGDPVEDLALTDESGFVQFSVPPSDSHGYMIHVVPVAGMVFTLQNVGDPVDASHVDGTGVTNGLIVKSGDQVVRNAGLVDPNLTVSKTANPASGQAVQPGQVVTYTVKFSNPGPAAPATVGYIDDLTGVTDDAVIAVTGITVTPAVTCTDTPNAIRGMCQLTAAGLSMIVANNMGTIGFSGTLQADTVVTVVYTATVGGSVTSGDHRLVNKLTPIDSGDPEIITDNPMSQILLIKQGQPLAGQKGTEGDTIAFTFRITNVGKTTLSSVTLSDELTRLSPVTFGAWPKTAGTLEPGESVTATASYILNADDVFAAFVKNEASVSGIDEQGNTVTSRAVVSVPLRANPALSLDKQVSASTGSGPVSAGTVLTYTFIISNTGDITLDRLGLTDDMMGLKDLQFTWPGEVGVLKPGEIAIGRATYTLTQADITNKKVTNTATITGRIPGWEPGDDVPASVLVPEVSATDTATYDVPITIISTGGTVLDAGDWLTVRLSGVVLLGAALGVLTTRQLLRREKNT